MAKDKYRVIPTWILYHEGTKPAWAVVWMELHSLHEWGKYGAQPSVDWLSEKTRVSKAEVKRAIAHFEKIGALSHVRTGRSNKYRTHSDPSDGSAGAIRWLPLSDKQDPVERDPVEEPPASPDELDLLDSKPTLAGFIASARDEWKTRWPEVKLSASPGGWKPLFEGCGTVAQLRHVLDKVDAMAKDPSRFVKGNFKNPANRVPRVIASRLDEILNYSIKASAPRSVGFGSNPDGSAYHPGA